MSYYPTPGAPYVPQQPVNPYGGIGTVGLATPLPNTQVQQMQQQRPQPMNGQQPVQQSAQDGGWLLGRPVSSREEFLAIPSDLYGRPTYCPDLRSGVIYCKRLNPDTCESYVQEFYSPEAWRQIQAQQAQQTAAPTQQYIPQKNVKSAAVVCPVRLWFYLHFLSFLLYGTPRQFTFFFGTHRVLSG